MDTKTKDSARPIPPHILHHLTAHSKSGKTISAYCNDVGISRWSFYDWRKKYGKEISGTSGKPIKPPGPMPFTALGSFSIGDSNSALFDIRFSSGTSIRVYHGTPADVIAPYIDLLSGASRTC